MKFLITGLGSIGRRHLRLLAAQGQKDITLFRTHQSTLPDEDLAGYPVETVLEKALAKNPDGVIISNPTRFHLDIAIPAAEAGCHILLEKPISDSMDRVEELQKAADRSGSKILVGFQFRYHPALQIIKEILQSNQLGKVISFRAHWGEYLPNWHPWEDYRQSYAARKDLGGGVILTLTHPLDYSRMLFGEVESLWAFSGKLGKLEIDVEDTAEIGLKFKNGPIGSVHINYNQQPPRHQLEIVCTDGTVRWDNAEKKIIFYDGSKGDWTSYPLDENFDRDSLFTSQIQHFIKVAAGEEKPFCTLDDGIWSVKLAQAAKKSSQEKIMISF
jgi:predicted dehydrogenase